MEFLIGIIVLCILGVLYFIYQLRRNRKVRNIRMKWIAEDDNRYHTYTYDHMMKPSKHNMFGFKFPNDDDY